MEDSVEITFMENGQLLISDDNPELLLSLLGGETDGAVEAFLDFNASERICGDESMCG